MLLLRRDYGRGRDYGADTAAQAAGATAQRGERITSALMRLMRSLMAPLARLITSQAGYRSCATRAMDTVIMYLSCRK